jgi:hypothetical protein
MLLGNTFDDYLILRRTRTRPRPCCRMDEECVLGLFNFLPSTKAVGMITHRGLTHPLGNIGYLSRCRFPQLPLKRGQERKSYYSNQREKAGAKASLPLHPSPR